jgi:hypothetical protein
LRGFDWTSTSSERTSASPGEMAPLFLLLNLSTAALTVLELLLHFSHGGSFYT